MKFEWIVLELLVNKLLLFARFAERHLLVLISFISQNRLIDVNAAYNVYNIQNTPFYIKRKLVLCHRFDRTFETKLYYKF